MEDLLIRSAPTPFQDVIFNGTVTLVVGYDVNELPDGATTLEMYYLDDTDVVAGPVWEDLDADSDVVAGAGELSKTISGTGIYAVMTTFNPPIAPPTPPDFRPASLNITRSTEEMWSPFVFAKKVGEDATASMSISNVGGEAGVFQATLLLNGTVVQTVNVDLGPGASKNVIFNIDGNEPGDYTVQVAGLAGSFESVVWINWWLIV